MRTDDGEVAARCPVPCGVLDEAFPSQASEDLGDLPLGSGVWLDARDAVLGFREGRYRAVDLQGDCLARCGGGVDADPDCLFGAHRSECLVA